MKPFFTKLLIRFTSKVAKHIGQSFGSWIAENNYEELEKEKDELESENFFLKLEVAQLKLKIYKLNKGTE